MSLKDKILIGIADCSKYAAYERWLLAETGVNTICLSYHENNLDDLNKCQGVLLTGGEDVAPQFYNKPEYLPLCEADNMDARRDEFELKILDYVRQNEVPLLGICRGLQIANVFFGGTLIPDIPSAGKEDHSKIQEGKDRVHEIRVNPFSKLKAICGVAEGEVNSAHHQAADKIGTGLVPSAFSADGIVEALEMKGENGPWLTLVQWHPERMIDQENALTKKIKLSFLESAFARVRA